jgi:hypothetical protein
MSSKFATLLDSPLNDPVAVCQIVDSIALLSTKCEQTPAV